MPCGLPRKPCFPKRRQSLCDANNKPRVATGLMPMALDLDQTATGCSMMPVGTSANITEER